MDFILLFLENVSRTLPWTPKVRQKDLDSFLDYTRMKFVGFTLKDDRTTLAGLPNPIHESVRILNNHMYKSLAELQIEVRRFSKIPVLYSSLHFQSIILYQFRHFVSILTLIKL